MLLTAGGWEPPTASNLKVVSIVGFGGLGKTTLANAVHRKLVQEFDCRVFVSVSQNPDITKLLSKILVDELKGRTSSIYSDVRDIINDIRSHLLHKRYLVIIDDLWETSVWDVLKCAFPDNNCGSRVITTTRVESVAKTCCNYQVECIYKMNPLNDEDSRILFFNRIFGPGVACPSELKDVSSKILEKCGGLPLAIITIASLLASQAGKVKEEWEHVQNSLGSKLGIDPTVEGMRQILNLSYRNLPPHLKTCFLYLGAYPEDCIIWKDDLVRQWIAEGFVSRTLQPVMDVAGYYFNELINRSLIQPVEIGYNDEVLCCRVHDMMLDLIIRKYCAEEKFMTMLRASQGIRGYTHNVRRLVNHLDSESQLANFAIPATIDLSKVRSLATIVSPQQTLCLQKFKFIRVLVLQIAYVSEETREADMSEISKLCLLRYLKIHSEVGLKLPTQIRALQHLETLEIVTEVNSGVCMPSDMSQLPSLSYLNVLPHMARLPDGVATMRSLHSLAFFILEESSLDNVRGLQCLTNLKELYLRCSGDCSDDTARSYMDALQSSVSGLGCKLYLTAWFPSAWYPDVPQWVSQLKNLHSLELGIGQMSKRGTSILGGLPALVRLDLCIRGPSLDQERAVFSGEGFPVLKHLIFTCKALCLTFQPGALPMLKNLRLEFNMDGIGLAADALVGVEHLRNLKKLSASIGGFKADASIPAAEREGVVSAVRNAIQLHPRCPPIEVTCRQGRFGY
ncbi:disease resistance protein RGA5-like [Oryza brachyantha]|uniref:disease resistance protein RGA5-like n=1 Tax=Oryza brachyantha TaxID=4533 RepID=UPI001ADA0754|nr:disease resistance protein RGA5-like [Oryza brachyantha]